MEIKKKDKVIVNGKAKYTSYGGAPGAQLANYKGEVTYTNEKESVPYPVHVDQKGWFALTEVNKIVETKAESIKKTISNVNNHVTETDTNKKLARRVLIALKFEGNDITQELNKYLISASYTDNSENKADGLNVTIDDHKNEWLTWLKSDTVLKIKGAEISAVIIQKNYDDKGNNKVLNCGTFEVDTVNIDGPPQRLTFKASSVSAKAKIRTETKTKAWEKYSLQGIAAEIAANAGYTLYFESDINPTYKRCEQVEKSDIVFLKGLCKNAGISLKVTNKALVLYDQVVYEKKDAILTINRKIGGYTSYSFSSSSNDTSYLKCHVSYTDPETEKTIEATYTAPGVDKNNKKAQTLEVSDTKITSTAEALKLAEKRLRSKNKGEYEADFTIAGNLDVVVGVNINIEGWGAFDGKYNVNTATHSLTGGYKTEIKMTRVMEGY